MKNLKKLLKQQKNSVLPDQSVKDNIKLQLGMVENQPAAQTAVGGTVAVRRRGVIIAVCAAALAIVMALCIILPLQGVQPTVDPGTIDGGNDDGKFDEITDSDTFYAYGAASVGAVLSSWEASSSSQSALRTAANLDLLSAPTQEEMDTINRYLALVEGLLSEGDITGTAIAGYGDYAYGMTVSYSDLLGASVSYVMYYNKIFRSTRVDGDEREENYSIEGVLIVENISYPVMGNYTSESEEDEEESTLFFRAYMADDTYIEVTRESESETGDGQSESETEYVYTVYRDGRVVERTVVEYESEDGELELLVTIERDGLRERLIFEDESEDGQRVIAVRGNIGGEEVSFRIYVREGQYHYVFDDDSSQDYDRYDDDDDDDRRGRRTSYIFL